MLPFSSHGCGDREIKLCYQQKFDFDHTRLYIPNRHQLYSGEQLGKIDVNVVRIRGGQNGR